MTSQNNCNGVLCIAFFTAVFLPGVIIAAGSEVKPNNLFEMSLEQLMNVQVTTISRIKERRDDAPGSIYVYSADVIKTRGYRSLGELLQTVPGFTVFHRDLQFVAGVRGLNANDNEKITLLINGQEFNGVQELGFLNGPINLDNVDRVEVVVGPSSFFQRANTLAATVNVITKDTNGAELVFSTGNDLPYSATLMAGKQFEKNRSLSFSFTTERKEGFDAWSSDFRPGLAGGKETGKLENGNFFSVLNGRDGDWFGQFVAYKTISPELLINNGSSLNDGTYTDEIYSIYAKNEHEIDRDLTSLFSISASYKRSSRLNYGGLPQPDTAAELLCAQRDYDMELGLRYTGFQKHLIQMGVQGAYEDNSSEKNWFTWNALKPENLPSFPQKTLLYNKDTSAAGLYVSDNYKVDDQLEFINGVRTDMNTTLGSRWFVGGSSAIVYHPTETWTTKLVYNRSVRFPTTYAANNEAWGRGKNGPPWTRHFPNAEEPEILSTVEWQNIFYIERFRFALAPYYQDLSNFISWSEPHSNVGNFRGYGVEGDIQAQITPDVLLWANTSFNDSELHAFNMSPPPGSGAEQHHALVNSDNKIVGSAKIVANTGIDWNITKNVILSGTIRYFTNQVAHDHTTNQYIEINNRYYLDAAILWKNAFGKDMDLRLSGTNILDNREPIGGQWLGDTYKPRGATFVISAYIKF